MDMAKGFESQLKSMTFSEQRFILPFWELPTFRFEWFDVFSLFDGFIVGTNFLANAIFPLTTKPIYIVNPLLPLPRAANKISREGLNISEGDYVFLYVYDVRSGVVRKNPELLIRAFEELTSSTNRGIHLILKVTGGEEFYKPKNSSITVIDALLSDSELNDLYVLSDCYVSPHRSEGLGLTLIEALGNDCALIYTPFAGSEGFPELAGLIPLEFDFVEIQETAEPYQKYNVWADPRIDSLVSAMAKAASEKLELSNAARMWTHQSFFSPILDEGIFHENFT
jgi:hypothetical protein